MASTDFPELTPEPEEEQEEMAEEKTGGGFVQPSLEDWSTESMWDLNRKTEVAGAQYDHRIVR